MATTMAHLGPKVFPLIAHAILCHILDPHHHLLFNEHGHFNARALNELRFSEFAQKSYFFWAYIREPVIYVLADFVR